MKTFVVSIAVLAVSATGAFAVTGNFDRARFGDPIIASNESMIDQTVTGSVDPQICKFGVKTVRRCVDPSAKPTEAGARKD
ncbi:hypothetical protein IB238_15015 [Rhizobium sp. ARZ01]|uniref:hypothetical protein n=1 Tax=Rhizobium sp. ARZ01 TaxID=2769313 RepID=UPI001781ACF3|nr:hypothetical protein [Rhizobium sp. ARZ01]MBD9373933.1 hypothetical protein [Rhizobium sp. ARZ01]